MTYLDDLQKVRRRIEDYLRKCTPEEIVRIARSLKIKVPKSLLKLFGEDNSKANSR